jgi:hypothetical protein
MVPVALASADVRERSRILPPCFSTIERTSHKPNPVPFSPRVVKKRVNRRLRWIASMPEPVSANVIE